MPTLQRDKGGLNFILHVIQIIYLLLKDTPDAAEKCQLRVENLQRYARRYQNDYGAERSRWLIEIINELTLNDFQPKIWQENERIKENKYKLLHTPYDIFDSNYDAEPIPMPRVFDLLEIIVSMPKVYQL
jgi:hypothetical protein